MPKGYTLSELTAKTDREWYTADEICSVLNMDPQTLRLTAKQRPYLLAFPVLVTGTRVRFPRIPFLRYMGVDI